MAEFWAHASMRTSQQQLKELKELKGGVRACGGVPSSTRPPLTPPSEGRQPDTKARRNR
ncbi:hypothetical protein E4U13_001932 [Claviceps humidiphila]|uniref:Uncharacterized protein n=1 Tax=Claviceps humidiphila TaxID=1294629 RepID=A0A9P7TXV8_9HYPO|nr:hypothetical protein E4U13_001932 [Claviceps humidiphila]